MVGVVLLRPLTFLAALPIAILPRALQAFLGRRLGDLLRLAMPKRVRIARANLAIAFPEADEAQIEAWARGSFRHLGEVLIDLWQSPLFRIRPLLESKIRKIGWEVAEAAKAHPEGVVVLSAHFGSWEVSAAITRLLPLPIAAVYKPSKGFGNTLLNELRSVWNVELIPKSEAKQGLEDARERGLGLGLVADQGGHQMYPFFGREKTFPHGSAHYCVERGAFPLVVFAPRDEHGIYQIRAQRLDWELDPTLSVEENKERFLKTYIELLEETVRRYPDQYYWLHDMWRLFK